MASITGHCPVCREVFIAEARTCGHPFCLDCLTRIRENTFGLCPFCGTAFHPEDIRWRYELDNPGNEPRYASSDSVQCPTVLEWIYEARDDLEKKLFEVTNNRNCPSEVLSELRAEITAWFSAYEATMMPPENKPLAVAAETLAIASRRTEQLEEMRAQLTVMRRDVRMLQEKAAETTRARRDAELKVKEQDIEIHALRDLNRLYRHVSGIKGPGPPHMQAVSNPRRSKHVRVPPYELEEFIPSKLGVKHHKEHPAISGNAPDLTPPDIRGGGEQHVQKTVRWFRTSFRRTAPPSEDI